jgi:ATP-dependent RNA helicase RhlE
MSITKLNLSPLKQPRNPGGRQHTPHNASKKAALNPALFVQQAVIPVHKTPVFNVPFEKLDLGVQLKANIRQMGFTSPTDIQAKTYDHLLGGQNLIGIANTGTGKTGAFLIPLLEKSIRQKEGNCQSLIIVPTRELALQVYDEFVKLAKGIHIKAACFIGGTNLDKDIRTLSNQGDIIIGTPGRLLDLAERGALKMNRFEVLVLDEFDKMLDMGFVRDIRKLVDKMKMRKQTILFSATKDPKQQAIISEMVQNPLVVEIHSGDKSSKNVDQDIIQVGNGQDRYLLLLNLLEDTVYDKVILFTETKHLANRLSKKLNESGIKSDQIHGNKSQNYRVNALNNFKKGNIRVLVATDVAARGIDVNNVSLVINYQAPTDFDTYIHRVGRTGRAGKTGTAYTFVD